MDNNKPNTAVNGEATRLECSASLNIEQETRYREFEVSAENEPGHGVIQNLQNFFSPNRKIYGTFHVSAIINAIEVKDDSGAYTGCTYLDIDKDTAFVCSEMPDEKTPKAVAHSIDIDIERGCECFTLCVQLNPSSIKGAGNVVFDRDRHYRIWYTVTLTDKEKGKKYTAQPLGIDGKGTHEGAYIDITIKRIVPHPVFSIEWNDKAPWHGNPKDRQMQYGTNQRPVSIGYIVLSHSHTESYAPSMADVDAEIQPDKDGDMHYQVTKIIQDVPLRPGESRRFELQWKQGCAHNPGSAQTVHYPLLLSAHLDNGEAWPVEGLGGVTLAGSDTVADVSGKVLVPTPLRHEEYDLFLHQIVYPINDTVISRPSDNAVGEGARQRLTWTFCNTAEGNAPGNNASVIVWGAELKLEMSEQDRKRVLLCDSGLQLEDILTLTQGDGEELQESWHLRGKRPEQRMLSLSMTICTDDFLSIEPTAKTSCVNLKATLTYHLHIDRNGEYPYNTPESNASNLFHSEVNLRIKMTAREKWLSIDFGTSAVVAHCGSQPINLRKIKDTILSKAFPNQPDKCKNGDEVDYVINSTVSFNPACDPNMSYDELDEDTRKHPLTHYRTLPLWFSPSEGTIDYAYQLPCLKMLMGYKVLPRLFKIEALQGFKYGVTKVVNGATCVQPTTFYQSNPTQSPLMHINTIFTQVYRQMFNYFIRHHFIENAEDETVNRLVLTVPNTYNPIQLAMLKKIAREAFPSIYPEYFTLVSESDAVAHYYQAHLKTFHSKLDASDPRHKRENVLIYDMGAGTLDLTYFTRTTEGKCNTIDIKCRIGIPKAGNYLDYVLAEALVDLIEMKCDTQGNTRLNMSSGDIKKLRSLLSLSRQEAIDMTVNDRSVLRQYVHNELKPVIGSGKGTAPCPEFKSYTFSNNLTLHIPEGLFTVSDFTHHPAFTQYIEDVTTTVFRNFRHMLNVGSMAKVNIDTIIFSGRSSSLQQVRNAVKTEVESMAAGNVKYADISGGELTDNPSRVNTSNTLSLKNVVTDGALSFASRYLGRDTNYRLKQKPFYVNYGIITIDTNDKMTWYPLLDVNKTQRTDDGIYRASCTLVDINQITKIAFVQTSSAHPTVDYADGNMDSMTVLATKDGNNLADQPDDATLDIVLTFNPNTDSQLSLMIGAEAHTLSPFLDFSSETLRRGLWPIVFN